LSKSETLLKLVVTLSSKIGLVINSHIISCLFSICSIFCKGFTIASLKNLLHIGVFVLSKTQNKVQSFDDFEEKL
jgi:hypothetical protein